MRAYTSPLWADYWEGERKLYEQYREIIKTEKEVYLDHYNKCIKIDGELYFLVSADEATLASMNAYAKGWDKNRKLVFDEIKLNKRIEELKNQPPKENNDVGFYYFSDSIDKLVEKLSKFFVKREPQPQSEVSNGDGLLGFLFIKENGTHEFVDIKNNELVVPEWAKNFSIYQTKKAPVDDGLKTYTGEELGLKGKDADITVHFKGMPQFNDVELDYEILTTDKAGVIHPYKKICDIDGCEIKSVKRLSDGIVFSVGDETNKGIITAFRMDKVLWVCTDKTNNCLGQYLSELTKKPSPSKEQVEEKKIITPDPNFMHDLDDKWGEFTPYENEKRMWYGEKLYNELCEKYKSQPKSEPTLTDKTISYKELLDYCNTNCLISELLEHFKPKS